GFGSLTAGVDLSSRSNATTFVTSCPMLRTAYATAMRSSYWLAYTSTTLPIGSIESHVTTLSPALRVTVSAAVGLDKKGTSHYERVMGFGGQWEQTGTSCDKAEVRLTLNRDRTFRLKVKTSCQGSVFESPFKGQWRLDPSGVILILPNK